MTREELRDYVDEQRGLNNIPYHVYSALIDGIDTLEQKLCEDAISRQAAIDIVDSYSESQSNVEDVTQDIISDIMVLPPDTLQSKTGYWIDKDIRGSIEPYCSVCGDSVDTMYHYDYCPNCGAKMNEVKDE